MSVGDDLACRRGSTFEEARFSHDTNLCLPLTTCPTYTPARRMVYQRLILRRLERAVVFETMSGSWDPCS